MKFYYVIIMTCMLSFSVFSDVECDNKRKMNPHQFSNAEFEIRRDWQVAYYSFKHEGKKTPSTMFVKAVKSLNKSTKKTFRDAVVHVYEHGDICQAERWMKPQRFIEIFKRCRVLAAVLQKQNNLQVTLMKYANDFARYQQEHDQDEGDFSLNTQEQDFDKFLAEQAQQKSNGLAHFAIFSIKNFEQEVQLTREHFALKREELKKDEAQEKYLKKVLLAREKQIVALRNGLSSYLTDNKIKIDEKDANDIELIYGVSNFGGDLAIILNLNKLLRQVKMKRVEVGHNLSILGQALRAAREHFHESNVDLVLQEKMDIYSLALDTMIITMKKYWKERIKDGYGTSLEGLLQLLEPHLQFFYVQEKLQEAQGEVSECEFCYEQRQLLPVCANSKHKMCADCLKNHIITQLSGNASAVSCPFLHCENRVSDLNYENLMAAEIFPYEFFNAFKNRWLRQFELKPNFARCHMGCLFFHEIPGDKVPGQASPPCPDCRTKTCFSCKNIAHPGSAECHAPDAEAMKAAHRKMIQEGHQRCPACGVWYMKDGGCDAVTCFCGQVFSFETGEPWQLKHAVRFGYHHQDVRTPVRINQDL